MEHFHFTPASAVLLQAAMISGVTLTLSAIRPIRNAVAVVVMQIFAGVLLGPTFFGHWFPTVAATIFPPISGDTYITTLAVVLFGNMVGLEFNPKHIKLQGGFPVISLLAIVVPFIFGCSAGWWLFDHFPELLGPHATRLTFVLTCGLLASVTALPVLGAILRQMGLNKTALGQRAIAYATTADLSLWILIAIIFALKGDGGLTGVWTTLGLAMGFLAGMVWLVRPIVQYVLVHKLFPSGKGHQLLFVFFTTSVAGVVAEGIGIHFLLGAFIAGTIIPRRALVQGENGQQHFVNFAHGFERKLEHAVMVIMVPFFFMSTGLRTDLQLQHLSPALIACFTLMTAATVLGKLIGVVVPSILYGNDVRESFIQGCLQGTKGMMEVVVLKIVLDGQLISSVCFGGNIMMTLLTTAAIMPLTFLLMGKQRDRFFVPEEHEHAVPVIVNQPQLETA